ncbi:MAG: FecR domain-containing protein [Proteiniphilum sp.]|nr:FecR domain-containing protein [Proteiniphilum sp.]MDD3909579.1 FecR domain-containing protein [Proteiniphilum sp.]
MNKNAQQTDKIVNEERELLLKNLFRHIHYDEMTPKEKKVIELLKKSYKPAKKTHTLTDKDLKKAIKRNQRQISKKIKISQTSGKNSKTGWHIPVLIGSSVAVITLLIIFFMTPFFKNDSSIGGTGALADSHLIEKQFITDNKIKKITLPDGSSVFLNKGTTISLRKGKFNAFTRELWLDEGEAYFYVAKDADRPFIVHTPNGIATKVLGTSFNIRAYAEMEEQVISVNTGRVQVYDESDNKIILDPDYKVSIKSGTSGFVADKTDAHNISAWRSGAILLEDATVKEVSFRLKQIFNIDLIYGDTVDPDEKIFTMFTADMPQEEVVATICRLYGVHYKRINNRVVLIK